LTCKGLLLRTQIDRRTIQFSKSRCREGCILAGDALSCQDPCRTFSP